MPASRSRTENWRRTLEQVSERNGAIELAIPRPGDESDWPGGGPGSLQTVNLVWRVRLLSFGEDELLIEQPNTLGERIELHDGIDVIVVFALGQNRWMFRSRTLGRTRVSINADHGVSAIRLKTPSHVERCQRRQFYRVPTIGMLLPKAEARPLLSMTAVRVAEAAVRARIELLREGHVAGVIGETDSLSLPEVGPPTTTTIVNLGGGGMGLMVDGCEARSFDQHRLFWVTMHMTPHIPAPISVVCRLVHVHMDSEQRRHLGMAFEFSHNPDYKRFVVNALCRCVSEIQRDQLRRRAILEDRSGCSRASGE